MAFTSQGRLQRAVLTCGAVVWAIFCPVAPAAAQLSMPAPVSPTTDVEALARRYFPSDKHDIPRARLFRLTREQIDATITNLLPALKLKSIKTALARDPRQMNYEYAELLALNAANVGGLTGWIAEIAARVKQNPAAAIACPMSDEACLAQRARAFALKAFRGDVKPERLDALATFYLASVKAVGLPQATADLVEIVLNSPDFLFRKEIDTGAHDRLTPAQLLQAVTYTIADAPPDAVGLPAEQAERTLRSGPDAAATIAALLQSKAARAKLVGFFRAWLEIKEPGDFTISTSLFPEFTPAYASRLVRDVQQFLAAELGKPTPSLLDIMQPAHALNDGASETATADPIAAKIAETDRQSRAGLLTLPAVVASHSGPTNTRPIKRGVFWARKVLCLEMEPPPKDLHVKLYDLVGATERQRIEQSTKGAACIGCHKIINPLGFFLEGYDALGRVRATDNGQPIDTRVLIDFLNEPPVATETAADAISALTESAQFKQCFVRQIFRFYMGRSEVPSDDPVMRRMFVAFATDDAQDVVKTVFTLVASDRIVRRR